MRQLATDTDPDDECAVCGTELNADGQCERCRDELKPLDFD